MKLWIYLIIVFLLLSESLSAQFGPQQIISTESLGAWSVASGDLDGDGNVDVVSSNRFASSISWYKNLDGNGNFSDLIEIASLNQPSYLDVIDLDGDNDLDILATAGFINEVVWYENTDGMGNFGPEKLISDTATLVNIARGVDIDGDEDIDVLIGTDGAGVQWFENLDGNGNFGTGQQITTIGSRSVAAEDIDGDDDKDIVAASSGATTLSWYENIDGMGTYGPQQIITGPALAVSWVFIDYIDEDEDFDVVATTTAEDKIAWFENSDGNGNFGTEQVVTLETDFPLSVHADDLDNDGDNDLLSASAVDNKIAWYENIDGNGDFGPQQIITTDAESARSVVTADIDNDGDMDVLSASRNDHKIAWYENLTILDIGENSLDKIELAPNPAEDILTLQIPDYIIIEEITIVDILGSEVFRITDITNKIDLSAWASGMYFVTFTNNRQHIVKKFLKNKKGALSGAHAKY